MPFKHKLSRRLALIRGLSLTGLVALVAGCMDGGPLGSDLDSPGTASPVVGIVATSDNPTVAPDQPTPVRAVAVTADGEKMPVEADWVALDGGELRDTVVNSKHMTYFSAKEPGEYRLVSFDRGKKFRDTTRVTVPKANSVSIAKIYILPAVVSLTVGQGQQFFVYGRTSAGDSVPVVASLQAPGGTASGLYYVAGDTAGSYTVVAKQHGGSLTASASVNISAPANAPVTSPAPDTTTSAPTPVPVEPAPVDTPVSFVPAPSVGDMTPPELPRTFLDTRFVAPTGNSIVVPAGGDLQAALNAAHRGDVIELAAGATYTGNFVLPAKTGSGWVTIRTATTLPSEGTRVTPSSAANFARIITPNSMPAIKVADNPAASYYRVMGVEISSSATMTYSLVSFHSSATGSMDQIPQWLILDRVFIHGTSTLQMQRCVTLNSRSSAVIDSWLSDCHAKGFDSQAIIAWNTPGPLKIVNNHLEAAGENIMFGGADPSFTGLIPSDIEIRGNYIYKPLAWKGVWTVKNLYESKNSQRVLIEGNVFENTWADAQDAAWVLKSQNQGGNCPQCITADYTIRWNKVRNVPKLLVLAATQYIPSEGGRSQLGTRFSITNNLCEECGQENRWTLQIGGSLTNVVIAHNTFDGPKSPLYFAAGDNGATTQIAFTDNVVTNGTMGIFGDSYAGLGAIGRYCPDCSITGNGVIGGVAKNYPSGNVMLSSALAAPSGIGVSVSSLTSQVASALAQ